MSTFLSTYSESTKLIWLATSVSSDSSLIFGEIFSLIIFALGIFSDDALSLFKHSSSVDLFASLFSADTRIDASSPLDSDLTAGFSDTDSVFSFSDGLSFSIDSGRFSSLSALTYPATTKSHSSFIKSDR